MISKEESLIAVTQDVKTNVNHSKTLSNQKHTMIIFKLLILK